MKHYKVAFCRRGDFLVKYLIVRAVACVCLSSIEINVQQEDAALQDMISLLVIHLCPRFICLSTLLSSI